jgi:hypothetical protein
MEDGPRPHGLQEASGGAGTWLGPPVPVIQQAAWDYTRLILVTVCAVVTPRKGAHFPCAKNGANGFCAVDAAPVLSQFQVS